MYGSRYSNIWVYMYYCLGMCCILYLILLCLCSHQPLVMCSPIVMSLRSQVYRSVDKLLRSRGLIFTHLKVSFITTLRVRDSFATLTRLERNTFQQHNPKIHLKAAASKGHLIFQANEYRCFPMKPYSNYSHIPLSLAHIRDGY